MPASRPRKKTQQKQAASARAAHSKARMQKLANELNASGDVPACTNCKSGRSRVTEAEVPPATWEGMAEMRENYERAQPRRLPHCLLLQVR